jgi:hypothetical protein
MRDYGKVHTTFWSSTTTRNLSEDGRALALYLLTSPHSTITGVFRLPDGYVCDDMQWSSERVAEGFAELFRKGFANRCETTKWVWISKHLKWNEPENPNQRKSAAKVALSIPDECVWKADFIGEWGGFLGIEWQPLPNPSRTVPEPFLNQKQEQEQEQKQKQEQDNPIVERQALDPVETIFAFWKKVMSSPKSALDAKRRKLIETALKSYQPADVCKAIRGCSKSPFNMGKNDRKTKYNGLNLILRDAEHIDHFISLDSENAKPAAETIDEMNARIAAEFLGDAQATDDNTIEMEA